jgi:GDPmannose 4,6-dehydratase
VKVALITGITGFVGPYLAKKLIDQDYTVYGLYRRRADGSRPQRLAAAGIADDVTLIEGDVTDLTSLIFALDKCQPDYVFHLASQSFVPRSFSDPLETFRINSHGTQNLLEAVRLKELDCRLVFAGSSEEYGLQIASEKHYEWLVKKYGEVFPPPERIPELPANENNLLRPVSPYAVSKVYGELLFRNYHHAYEFKTVVSRAFNHEGAGRGPQFVTSSIVRQCVSLKCNELSMISIGDVNVFRDWSHVEDIVDGYTLLAEKAQSGGIYVQGSQRTNSVLTYILLVLEQLGYEIKQIQTLKGGKKLRAPTERSKAKFFGTSFEKTVVDEHLLNGDLEYGLEDKGLEIATDKGEVRVEFDATRFRRADVPILMADTTKIAGIGFRPIRELGDIIRDQINYYLNPENRQAEH